MDEIIEKVTTTLGAENMALISNEVVDLQKLITSKDNDLATKDDEIASLTKRNADLIVANGNLLSKVSIPNKDNDTNGNNNNNTQEADLNSAIKCLL